MNDYFELSYVYANQSICTKRQVGCVVVKDNEVIAVGFNHGYNELCGCNPTDKNPHVLHAEQMALQGIDDVYRGATLYVTYQPCLKCAVLIQQRGISTVWFDKSSKTEESILYLLENNIEVYQYGRQYNSI